MENHDIIPSQHSTALFLQQQKAALRQDFLQRRFALTGHERAQKSEAICDQLWQLPEIQAARTVHTYWPIVERGEIDLRPLILRLIEHGKYVALPVLTPKSAWKPGEPRIYSRLFETEHALTKNPWGVSEPLQGKCVPSNEIDAFIVPALGISGDGYRIGYGKGHYDELLSGNTAPKVCAVYAACLVDQVPTEPHDVPMSIVLTENEILRPTRT